jgi:hypothetical protein
MNQVGPLTLQKKELIQSERKKRERVVFSESAHLYVSGGSFVCPGLIFKQPI